MLGCKRRGLVAEVSHDLRGSPCPEELVQLHELEHFKHVLELQDPRLRGVSEQDLDPVAFSALHHGRMTDLVKLLLAKDTDLCHKRLIVLQYLDGKLIGAIATIFPLAHSELETSEPIPRYSMLHTRHPTQVGNISLLLSCLSPRVGVLGPCVGIRPCEANLASSVNISLFDKE